MTSPISTEDLEGLLPRGYVLSPQSSGVYATVDNSSSSISLGPGVHRLACTWEGEQTVGINVARDGAGTRRLAEFAGGGRLFTTEIGVNSSAVVQFYLGSGDIAQRLRGTVTVYTMPKPQL